MDALIQDIRFAFRQLRKNPGYTVIAVLTLALGIGANTTMFTLVDRVLLHPLPGVHDPEAVLTLAKGPISYPAFHDVREMMKTADAAAWRNRQLVLSEGATSRIVTGHVVTGSYFQVLGVEPALGRILTDADDVTGVEPVAVVSQAFWEKSLHAARDVIGQKLVLNGAPVTIVGVAGAGFRGLLLTSSPDLWVSVHAWPLLAPRGYSRLDIDRRGWGWLTLIGRLKPGVTMAQAQSEVDLIRDRLFKTYPNQDARFGTVYAVSRSVQTATGLFGGRTEIVTFLAALMGVVGLVLLLTCANVANLALARAAGRRQEMAVRVALGAKNQRLFQQMIVESVIIALLGGCAAMGLAGLGTGLLARFTLPGGIAVNPADLAPDAPVLAFTALVSLVASVLFGLAPALKATRIEAGGQLRDSLTRWAGHDRLRYLLVAGQVALCVMLVSGAGLFARSLARALSIDPGFRTDHVAMATAYPDLTRLDSTAATRYLDEALLRLKARPAIRAAAWTTLVPLVGDENTLGFNVPGYVSRPNETLQSEAHFIGPDFFSTLNVPVVEGRSFRPEDRADAAPVVIVSKSFAQRYWPGRSPVGQAMTFDSVPATVVGLVPDVRWRGLVGEAPPMFYLPIAQRAGGSGDTELTLIALTESSPAGVLPEIRETLREVNRDVPVGELGTFDQAYASLLAPQRTGVTLLGSFSALALLLAVVGIGGVVAHGVAQRRREIGIRIALGAGSGAVQRLAVRSSMHAVALGLAVGCGLALIATRAISTFLYGVSPTDLLTFAGTAVLLGVAAGIAAWLPARRASVVDPLVALRAE